MIDVQSVLPHRPPFLFVDRVLEMDEKRILAERVLRPDEYFFKGHYPGHPLMPGALTCEAMFQAGAILLSGYAEKTENSIPVVTRVDRVRFKRTLKPGDTLLIEVIFLEKIVSAYILKGKVRAGDRLAASCVFTCMILPAQD